MLSLKLRSASVAGVVIAAISTTTVANAVDDVVVALPTAAINFAVFYVADTGGFYKKHGLNVATRLVPGPAAANAVAAGSSDFSASSGLTLVRAVAKGAPLISVAEINSEIDVRVIVTKKALAEMGITATSSFQDRIRALKGRTIAIDAVSGIPDGVFRYVLKQGGLSSNDLNITPLQSDAMLAALQTNRIDGIAFLSPTTIQAELAGNVVLIREPAGEQALSALSPFPYTVLITNTETCRKRPNVCANMIAALKETRTFLSTNTKEAVEMLKKNFPALSAELIEDTLRQALTGMRADLKISEKSFERVEQFSKSVGFLQDNESIPPSNKLYNGDYNK